MINFLVKNSDPINNVNVGIEYKTECKRCLNILIQIKRASFYRETLKQFAPMRNIKCHIVPNSHKQN